MPAEFVALGPYSLDRECLGKLALARTWRPQQMDDIGAIDEVQSGQRQDPLRSGEGWKGKSNPAIGLITGSRAMRSAALIRRFSRRVSSSASRSGDGLDPVDLVLLDAT
jgi:hypothetical protein